MTTSDIDFEPNPSEPSDDRGSAPVDRPGWRWLPYVVVGFAAFVFLFRLASPAALIFDEVYYARDARSYRIGSVALEPDQYDTTNACDRSAYPDGICSWVHPPLGNFLIAAGEFVGPSACPDPTAADGGADCSAFQWRFASALAGIVAVAVTILLAFRLFRAWTWACIVGALVATDGLILTSARAAMLDIFLVAFVMGAFYLFTREHQDGPSWLLSAGTGIALGGALATKWAGALAIVAILLLAIAWTMRADRSERLRQIVRYGVCLIVIPAFVYLLVWIPYLAAHDFDFGALVELHARIARYHLNLDVEHPYKSSAWQWPLLLRPTAYHYEKIEAGTTHVLNIGNPVFWWLSIPAIGYTAFAALRKLRRSSAIVLALGLIAVFVAIIVGFPLVVTSAIAVAFAVTLGLIWFPRIDDTPLITLVGYGALFLPWLLISRPQFLFYMAPAVPFMAIACVWSAKRIWGLPADDTRAIRTRRGFLIAAMALVLIAFAALYPVWTAMLIPTRWWTALMFIPTWI